MGCCRGASADFVVITVAQKKLRDDLRLVAGIQSESLFRDAVRVRTLSQSGAATAHLKSWMYPSSTLATDGADDSPSSSESGQEHVLEILSKFAVPMEVEVLSLRYGLVSSDEEEGEGGVAEQQVFRKLAYVWSSRGSIVGRMEFSGEYCRRTCTQARSS